MDKNFDEEKNQSIKLVEFIKKVSVQQNIPYYHIGVSGKRITEDH